jgi:hypothetical protein
MNNQLDYNTLGRLLGGIYIALKSAMPEECAAIAHEILFSFSESPDVRPEDRRVYAAIFDCTNRRIKGDDEFETKRPCLTVITGGAA